MSQSQLILLVAVSSFVVGVLVGVVLDDVRDQLRDFRNERKPMPDPTESTPSTSARRKDSRASVWLLIIVLALNVVVSGLLIKTRIDTANVAARQSDFTKCVADYNQKFSAAYRARLAPSAAATEALDRVMASVAESDRAAFKAALKSYVDLRAKAKASQVDNPYPPLPDDYCGPVPGAKP
jgi:hypothetical protein